VNYSLSTPDPTTGKYAAINKFSKPADCILFGDETGHSWGVIYGERTLYDSWFLDFRHPGLKANIFFVDQHYEPLTFKELNSMVAEKTKWPVWCGKKDGYTLRPSE
jgi:hypothetical protein